MSEIDQLKLEARKLLEEVNYEFERTTGKHRAESGYNYESSHEYSFKNRLSQLKKKVLSLQISSVSLANHYNTQLSS